MRTKSQSNYNAGRSLTPLARGRRSKNNLFDRKASENLVKAKPAQPVISRPASRTCMINYDVFGYVRPVESKPKEQPSV